MCGFFFSLKVGVLKLFPLKLASAEKAILENPQKAKAVHIVFLEYFLPIFKLTKQNKIFSGKKEKTI